MADTQLWVARLGEKELRTMTRDINAREDSSDLFGVELRVERDRKLILPEVFGRRAEVPRTKWFEELVSDG